jgi:hypothetical protein
MGSFDKSSGGLGWIELVGGALKWCGAGDITEFGGKDNIEEPEEWGHIRTLLASWHRLDPSAHGLELSEVRSLLYPEEVVEILRKGGKPPPSSFGDWHAERAAIQALARTPDRMVPDTTKLGNHMRPYINRWFRVGDRDRSFARAISPATGKSYVPARWKVEER